MSMCVAKRLITRHRALIEAWGQFCEQIGIDHAVGLATVKQDRREFDDFMLGVLSEETIGDIQASEPEVIEREGAKLMETWE